MSLFQRRRRYVLAALILAAFAALLGISPAGSHRIHEAVEAGGLILILLGIAGRLWCTLYIGGRKNVEIVRSGPYSITRNPLYFFSTLAAGGVGAQSGSLTLGVIFLLASWAAFSIVIRREETYLAGLFGPAYDAYRRSVPRFWPDPRLFKDQQTLSVRTGRLYATLLDGLVFLVAIPAFETTEHLQATGVLDPVLWLY
ncbi:methyltransferase family protein [Aureimonas populi]|uniref:Methyltransferase family protein n=1 Tax=Aureimonas populi TaxID=1701758 RepID=A0ABW5CPF3_9HYPH|nr:isoprenylcysteine carboxylmethyltransferase family protein [Aureimonas populi]